MARRGAIRRGLTIGLAAGVGAAVVRAARARRATSAGIAPPTWPPLPTALAQRPPAATVAPTVDPELAAEGTAGLVAEAAVLEAVGVTEAAEIDVEAAADLRARAVPSRLPGGPREDVAEPAERVADEAGDGLADHLADDAAGPSAAAGGAAVPTAFAPPVDVRAAGATSAVDIEAAILAEEAALEAERLEAERLELARLEVARARATEDEQSGQVARERERQEALARFAAQREEAQLLLALQEERAAKALEASQAPASRHPMMAGDLDVDELDETSSTEGILGDQVDRASDVLWPLDVADELEPRALLIEEDELGAPTLDPVVPDEAMADLDEEPFWGAAVDVEREPEPGTAEAAPPLVWDASESLSDYEDTADGGEVGAAGEPEKAAEPELRSPPLTAEAMALPIWDRPAPSADAEDDYEDGGDQHEGEPGPPTAEAAVRPAWDASESLSDYEDRDDRDEEDEEPEPLWTAAEHVAADEADATRVADHGAAAALASTWEGDGGDEVDDMDEAVATDDEEQDTVSGREPAEAEADTWASWVAANPASWAEWKDDVADDERATAATEADSGEGPEPPDAAVLEDDLEPEAGPASVAGRGTSPPRDRRPLMAVDFDDVLPDELSVDETDETDETDDVPVATMPLLRRSGRPRVPLKARRLLDPDEVDVADEEPEDDADAAVRPASVAAAANQPEQPATSTSKRATASRKAAGTKKVATKESAAAATMKRAPAVKATSSSGGSAPPTRGAPASKAVRVSPVVAEATSLKPPDKPARKAPPKPADKVAKVRAPEPQGKPAMPAKPAKPARQPRKKKADVLWVEPMGETCPPSHPVKASVTRGIFHVVGGVFYERTQPERCYRVAAAAEADGLRQAKR